MAGREYESKADDVMSLSRFRSMLESLHIQAQADPSGAAAGAVAIQSALSKNGETKMPSIDQAVLGRWHTMMAEASDPRILSGSSGKSPSDSKDQSEKLPASRQLVSNPCLAEGYQIRLRRPKPVTTTSNGNKTSDDLDKDIGAIAIEVSSDEEENDSKDAQKPYDLETDRIVTWKAALWLFFGNDGAMYYKKSNMGRSRTGFGGQAKKQSKG